MAAVTIDYNAMLISAGAIVVALVGTIAPLYFKLISETRANKIAREDAALAVRAAAGAAQHAALAASQAATTAADAAATSGDLLLKFDVMTGKLDGKLDKLMLVSAAKARLEGVAEGKELERANPLVPAAVTIKDDSAPVIPPIASQPT